MLRMPTAPASRRCRRSAPHAGVVVRRAEVLVPHVRVGVELEDVSSPCFFRSAATAAAVPECSPPSRTGTFPALEIALTRRSTSFSAVTGPAVVAGISAETKIPSGTARSCSPRRRAPCGRRRRGWRAGRSAFRPCTSWSCRPGRDDGEGRLLPGRVFSGYPAERHGVWDHGGTSCGNGRAIRRF